MESSWKQTNRPEEYELDSAGQVDDLPRGWGSLTFVKSGGIGGAEKLEGKATVEAVRWLELEGSEG